jgi:hypothetical protein
VDGKKGKKRGESMRENCIEWLEGDTRATVTTYRRSFIKKLKAISEENPSEVEIIKENKDGSICAHVPLYYVRISPKKKVVISEERRQELRESLARAREERCGKKS